MVQYMVAAGDPKDGFVYVGPFKTMQDAVAWQERVDGGEYWWVLELEDPEEQEHNTKA